MSLRTFPQGSDSRRWGAGATIPLLPESLPQGGDSTPSAELKAHLFSQFPARETIQTPQRPSRQECCQRHLQAWFHDNPQVIERLIDIHTRQLHAESGALLREALSIGIDLIEAVPTTDGSIEIYLDFKPRWEVATEAEAAAFAEKTGEFLQLTFDFALAAWTQPECARPSHAVNLLPRHDPSSKALELHASVKLYWAAVEGG